MAENTVYLLDALFLLIAGMAAIFAFTLTTSRLRGTFKLVFFVFIALFLFTLLFGFWPQVKPFVGQPTIEEGSRAAVSLSEVTRVLSRESRSVQRLHEITGSVGALPLNCDTAPPHEAKSVTA